jgi:hypothetical protein
MNWTNAEVFAFGDGNPAAGGAPDWRIISLIPEVLATLHKTGTGGLHYDAVNDRLYVPFGGSVLVFDQASTTAGKLTPSRTITPSGTYSALSGFDGSMDFDAAKDVIWLPESTDSDGQVLLQISNASTANGTVSPTHVYPVINTRFVIDKQRSLLYAASSGNILRYDMTTLHDVSEHIDNIATGFAMPTATTAFTDGDGLAIDSAHDRLYQADGFNGLHIVANASTVTSATVVVDTIAFTRPVSATYDAANDRLWVGGGASNGWIFNAASTINGSTPVPSPVRFGPPLPPLDPNDTSKSIALITSFAFP